MFARRTLRDTDLGSLTLPRAPRVSSDGERLLFLLESVDGARDQMMRRLRIMELADRTERAFDELGDILHARWAPDGAIILALPETDGARVVRMSVDGQLRTIAVLSASPTHFEISPDGGALALTMAVRWQQPVHAPPSSSGQAPAARRGRLIERTVWRMDGAGELDGHDQLFRLDLQSGSLHQLTDDLEWVGYFESGISWSPDGLEVLMAMNLAQDWEKRPFASSIYAVNVLTKTRRELIGGGDANVSPYCARDTNRFAFRRAQETGAVHLVPSLWMSSLDGLDHHVAADVGQDIGRAEWAWHGEGLYFSYVRDGSQRLGYFGADGVISELAEGLATDGVFEIEPYIGGGAEFCACPHGVIAVIANRGDPGCLVLIDAQGRKTDLSDPNSRILNQIDLGRCERLETPVPWGGCVQSWLVYPPEYDAACSYPLIVEIHGGPDLAFGGHFGFRAQRFAAEGYLVLMPNYRGSSGTDQMIYEQMYSFPDREHEEVLAAVDAVIDRASIDLRRIYVSGLSAGGVLSAWMVGKSQRFAAAVVRGPVINWISHSLTHDLYSMYARRWFTMPPWEDPQRYWERSPLSLVGNMRTPTLIVQGEADMRTPASEGLQLYHALKLHGVATALLLLPDAAHVSAAPSHWIDELFFTLDWFQRHTRSIG